MNTQDENEKWAKERISKMTNARFGQGFCEWFVLEVLKEKHFKPERTNEVQHDFTLLGTRRCDVKGNRRDYFKRNQNYNNCFLRPYAGGDRRDDREYFQVVFFSEQLVMFTEHKTDEFPTPQEFYWPEIRLRLDAWDKYRKQKSRDKTTSTGSEQFKRETKEKIKEIFSIQGLCARPICRGTHNKDGGGKGWKPVHNSYPTDRQLTKYDCTIFFQVDDTGDGADKPTLEYLIAYPHKALKDTFVKLGLIRKSPDWIRNKGMPFYIDYESIREREECKKDYIYADLADLQKFIRKFFPE